MGKTVPQIVISLEGLFKERGLSCNPELYWEEKGDEVNLWVLVSLPEDPPNERLEEAGRVITAVMDIQEKTRQRIGLRIAERSHLISIDVFMQWMVGKGYTQYQG